MKKIVLQGFAKNLSAEEIQSAKDSNLVPKVSYQLSTNRAAGTEHKLELDETDVLEFVFDDNTTWMGSTDIIHDIFPEAASQANRAGSDGFEIPMYLNADEANRSLLGDIALKALNVFAKKAVSKKVIEVAAKLEKKALENMSGVYTVSSDFRLSKTALTDNKKPFLLFLHGTNSSTAGSFGELRGSELWKNMQSAYGQNIICLQHETMTKSPIQNVIDLFKELPDTCTLHVISHSRGGLVGDVLARFCNEKKGFTDPEIAYLTKTERTPDVTNINTLKGIAAKKTITVDKFIRVACPAYGTTILSKRLDHFLNISLNLLGTLFGPVGAALTAEFKELISAAVDTKNDPDQLPGLEAMNPASPFLKVLNNPDNSISSPLTVISGNCGIKFNLKALLIIASKLFYLRDNDLVVDTKSMYCGTRRKIPIQYFFDEGPEVDHVHYFKNKKTQDALLLALKNSAAAIPNFVTYQPSLQAALDRNALLGLDGGSIHTDIVTGKKPIAILLPGIMGSNLDQGDKKIWINYLRFLVGDLSKLDISKKDIYASSLIKTSYKKLVDFLSAEYDVVTFPFDWRLPMAEAAELLKAKIEQYLAFKVPIKIIGHSMGGVVTRDFIINHPATWKKLNASKDFKLLLLGAPLGGSYRIPYVLAGRDSIINQLSKIDLKHTKKELLDIFRKYPGLLGLLPLAKEPDRDFANENTWLEMQDASLFKWNIPDKKDLKNWAAYRDNVLAKMDLIEMDNVIYIAGQDDATVCSFEINKNLPDEKLVFKSTVEGDQSVTWDTGIPKKLVDSNRLYFVNVTHGALANNTDIFDGIAEILRTGLTDRLNRIRPVARGAATLFDTKDEEIFEVDERSLENSVFGIKEKPVVKKANTAPLKISISNGDLFYSKYPVLVGHFLTDGITGAESVINGYTGNLLKSRHRLNLYPGEIGTSQVFIDPRGEFKGTVVIGLGAPGKLSAMQLTKSVENGAIDYMYELRKNWKKNAGGQDGAEPEEVGISVLLIGSIYGNMSMGNSIRAIILGIQNANEKIADLKQDDMRIINKIEFVELYEDRSMQCLYLLRMFEKDPDSQINFWVPKKKFKKLFGSRTRIPIESDRELWNRIGITEFLQRNEGEERAEKVLRFSLSNGSSREEQRDLYTSANIVNELIEDLSTNNNWNEGLAKSVFELLVPNDFKDEIRKQYKTMWVLDSASASYPWELLHDYANATLPFCCSTGMIRQLQTDKYRMRINAASGNKALVVGDPDLDGFPFARQLKGAKEEAYMVADILKDSGYQMHNNCINRSSKEIIQALFKDEYRVIHLAGHGIFNEEKPNLSGMLIGNGVFLSAREIYQMSKVPDLVFVNCCFLGKVSGPAEELFSNRYKLAANIGTQLIMNGVKVVIAAGWAVDDEAAKHFTKVFYSKFLKGVNFGDSITAARRSTFEKYKGRSGGNNTWGAYQCYGDPYFSLPKIDEPGDFRSSFSKTFESRTPEKTEYIMAEEAEIDLNNLLNQVDSKGYTAAYMVKMLSSITQGVDAAGIRNAVITEKEAMLYAESNEYEQAIERFETLMAMEDSGFTLKALEKYCNIRAKLCVKKWQKGIDKNKQPAILDKVIADLKQLLNIGKTVERLCLMGSAYKRKAMISTTNTDRVKALISAARYYKDAYHKEQENKTYPLMNWLEIEKILQLVKNMAGIKTIIGKYKFETAQKIKKLIEDIRKETIHPDADMDYWKEIGVANALLCVWLMEGKNTTEITDKMVVDAYKKVWHIAGSQNKKVSEIEHFDFLLSAYSGLLKKPVVVPTIKKIKQDLETIME